jgi:uncharacterized protein (TIGR03663 family)
MKPLRIAGAFLIPVLLAAFLRFPRLVERPMHCDEAVHADKFGILLEEGRYEYSTVDFHGPSLYYLTLLPARLQGAARYTDISEITLRSVPASFGVLLVAAHALLVPFVGLPAAAAAALFAALSPAMVYYSRYYIHETLLVFFSFGLLLSAFCYLRSRRPAWAIASGAFLGLMYATKETWVISLACMSLSAIWMHFFERWRGNALEPVQTLFRGRHVLAAMLTAILVSVLLLSSFFSHPRGITDSVVAFATYFERGTGGNTWHVHPWYNYFSWILYFHSPGGPVWTEGLIILLAILGFLAGLSKSGIAGVNPRVLRFLCYYTLLMTLVYSVIPYKAPWNVLGFLHGMILLAGAGIVWLLRALRKPAIKAAGVAVVAAALVHLGWEAWAASIPYGADPCNPYVYAHTGKDVFTIVRQLEDLARVYPDGESMPIQIMSRENLWPLPWYLRRFSGVRWWDGVPEFAPNAPIILATPDMEPELIRKLYELPPPGERELYMNMFRDRVELRPQVELGGYIAMSLWDDYLQMEPKNISQSRQEAR